MSEQEAQLLTQAYVTLRNELHHLALQTLPAVVDEDCFITERQWVLSSKTKMVRMNKRSFFCSHYSDEFRLLRNKLWYYFGLF